MRLDKLISLSGIASRKETERAVRSGEVTVDGVPARRADMQINEASSTVVFRGEAVVFEQTVWLMLNKPEGYISATEDGRFPCVTELISERYQRRGLFPVGRLDKDTVGLMLLTDDGALAHLLLSPKRHVEKTYRFSLLRPLPFDAEEKCAAGIELGDFKTKPACLTADSDRMGGTIVLTEGKYHEIKRMMHALGTEVTYLERTAFASLPLDPALKRGAWRRLTANEIDSLCRALPDASRK